ncbi:MAG: sensory box sigma-54 dependent DNA-binding response regulator, in cluster [Bacteroidetes bacterium]|nr:sensory box sigma-54 dependent DNA-binding response regulator, in cluster [Bacteroidota bacterium]
MNKKFSDEIKDQHPLRKKALEKLYYFMSNPGRFSVLVIGERGTGKSRWIKQISEALREERVLQTDTFIEASCASFNNDNAEADIFGYEPHAFTDANSKGHSGLLQQADKGILFLDEVHHLEDRVKSKLLTALQTVGSGRQQGKFSFRKMMGDSIHYVEVRPIFGSNRTISELKNDTLLPDFYDRIAQLVIKLPSISETRETAKTDFLLVWEGMQFHKSKGYDRIKAPKEKSFFSWLSRLPLDGNFRDLQTISILWMTYWKTVFDIKHPESVNEKEIFDLVKSDFEKYNLTTKIEIANKFDVSQPFDSYKKSLMKDYAVAIAALPDYEKIKQADLVFNTGKTKKTIDRWLKMV